MSVGLFDCGGDIITCIYAHFCCPCAYGEFTTDFTASRLRHPRFVLILDNIILDVMCEKAYPWRPGPLRTKARRGDTAE
eukprot:261796-Prorocentrum_minimum.AAC.2